MTNSVETNLEIITVGRISIDLYANEIGSGFHEPQTFSKAVGGSSTNVAVALARLGHKVGVVTNVGDDELGAFGISELERYGVDTRFIGRIPDQKTPLALAAPRDPGSPDLVFYRDDLAPDLKISRAIIGDEEVKRLPLLWISGGALSKEPSRSTVQYWLRTRGRKAHTVLDLDYRAALWKNADEAREFIGGALNEVTVVIGNLEECSIATGMPFGSEPDDLVDALLDRGVETAVLKQGAEGVLIADKVKRSRVKGIPIEVVCGLGAGDAFGGAFAHGLLASWDSEEIIRYANAAGAIVASRLLCSEAMPTDREIRKFLNSTR